MRPGPEPGCRPKSNGNSPHRAACVIAAIRFPAWSAPRASTSRTFGKAFSPWSTPQTTAFADQLQSGASLQMRMASMISSETSGNGRKRPPAQGRTSSRAAPISARRIIAVATGLRLGKTRMTASPPAISAFALFAMRRLRSVNWPSRRSRHPSPLYAPANSPPRWALRPRADRVAGGRWFGAVRAAREVRRPSPGSPAKDHSAR